MSKYRVGIPCLEGLKLGLAFNNRLNDPSLLENARETYKDDDEIGFGRKRGFSGEKENGQQTGRDSIGVFHRK